MSLFHWTAGSVSTIRDYILAGHFTDHCAAIRLVAMSRFTPADHLDCIIASESAVTQPTDGHVDDDGKRAREMRTNQDVTAWKSVAERKRKDEW